MGMGPSIGGGMGRISLRNLRTFSSFKNPVYRIYYGSLICNMAPQSMQMMARSLLLYRLTGSAAILGLMALATALPMLFLSLYGGVIADRVQKKHVIMYGQIASAVVSLGIALSLTMGYLNTERAGSWWILMVASMLQGIAWGIMLPSRQAIIREIVSEEDLMNAVSLNTMGMNLLRLLAPALTGFLIDAFDFKAVYYAMTGLYCAAVVFIAFMPRTSTIAVRGGGALADIKEGFQYVWQKTHILLVLAFTLVAVLLSMPYMLLLPIFTEDILKVGAAGMGMLMSVSGIGAIAGSLVLASLPNKKRGLMLLASALLLGVSLTGFSFSSSWSLSLALIVFIGLGQTGRMTLANTLLQYYSNDEYRGRVMSIYMMEFGLTSFGTFGAGLLAEAIGVQWSVGGLALVLVFIAILGLFFLPRLRRLD
jgi:MFS family permease